MIDSMIDDLKDIKEAVFNGHHLQGCASLALRMAGDYIKSVSQDVVGPTKLTVKDIDLLLTALVYSKIDKHKQCALFNVKRKLKRLQDEFKQS